MCFEQQNFVCCSILRFLLGLCFCFINTISAIIFSFLLTNKPILWISWQAVSLFLVFYLLQFYLIPPLQLPLVLRTCGCSLNSGCTCGQYDLKRSSSTCLVFRRSPPTSHLLGNDAIITSKSGWSLVSKNNYTVSLPFSVSFFVASSCFLHIKWKNTHLLKKTFNFNTSHFN